LRPEDHSLAVDRDNRVAGLKTGFVGGLAGEHRLDGGVHVGQHANGADLEAGVVTSMERRQIRTQRQTFFAAVAHHDDLDFALGPGGHRHVELFPIRHLGGSDLDDDIAWSDAALLCRRTGFDDADRCRAIEVRQHIGTLHQNDGKQHHGEEQVHHRTHDQNLEPLPFGLRQELVITARARVVRVFARHLHVATERHRAEAILGIAALELQQLWSKAEREGQHADAVPAGHDEVAQLVEEHQNTENERKRQHRSHA
jgi:hypothetical protein